MTLYRCVAPEIRTWPQKSQFAVTVSGVGRAKLAFASRKKVTKREKNVLICPRRYMTYTVIVCLYAVQPPSEHIVSVTFYWLDKIISYFAMPVQHLQVTSSRTRIKIK